MQIIRVPPDNMSYSRPYKIGNRSALKGRDHGVGIDGLSEVRNSGKNNPHSVSTYGKLGPDVGLTSAVDDTRVRRHFIVVVVGLVCK